MAEKFRIAFSETAFPFIPPAAKFLKYVGMPGGLAGVINELRTHLDQPLLDPKTIRKAVREGVSPSSFNKIKAILDSRVTPEM